MDIIRLTEPVVVSHGKRKDPPAPLVDPSGIKRKILDIPYSSASDVLKLDLYLPEDGDGPYPTIVFFHGGAFWGGAKYDFQCLYALNGIFHGYAVASAEYRLADEAVFPAAVLDCKTAVRFLRANAGKYQLDPDRMAVMGDSAGAYMATMVGFSAGNPVFNMPDMEYPEESDSVADNFFVPRLYHPCVSLVHDLLQSLITCRFHLSFTVCFFSFNDYGTTIPAIFYANIKSAKATLFIRLH